MPALQPNPLQYNPNDVTLTPIATYDRLVHAGIERAWENVLDWEHLPHLHATSFDYVSLDEAGPWGWRTWSNADRTGHVELCIDKPQYVARSYQEQRQVSEIWTTLTPSGDNTQVHVEFHATDVPAASITKIGAIYLKLYEQLWDEDEAMMCRRQQRLTEQRESRQEVNLGSLEMLRAQLPITVQLKRGEFWLMERAGQLVCFSSICPHLLGPLNAPDPGTTTVVCHWHGYEFDTASGECLKPETAACKLPRPPRIDIEDGNVMLRYR